MDMDFIKICVIAALVINAGTLAVVIYLLVKMIKTTQGMHVVEKVIEYRESKTAMDDALRVADERNKVAEDLLKFIRNV